MYTVLKNEEIKKNIYYMEVEAPLVVNKCLPGQFVIVMANEDSERIPLTICDYNKESGVLSLVYQIVGVSTLELSKIKDNLFSVVGPLGNPSELVIDTESIKDKNIIFVAGGIGIAPVYPQIKYLSERGVKTKVIYGAKNKDAVIFEDNVKKYSDLIITTDDGSYGLTGFVTDALKKQENYDICVAIGPTRMMQAVSDLTRELGVKQIVSMNPIMVDGTGMCGACRLNVGGKIKFACVDGPEFDGHLVDFDNAIKRMNLYKTIEGKKYLEALEGDTHHGGCGNCGDE